jgi:acetylglutamate kinase
LVPFNSVLNNIVVIKLGGSTLGNHDTSLQDIVQLQQKGQPVVVVHGGGKTVTDWLEKMGVSSKFVHGLRVTDAAVLQVVVAVLAGLVNKELVAELNGLGGRALGLSGVDGALIEARLKDADIGLVGEIVKINPEPLEAILKAGYVPVVAPPGCQPPQQGQPAVILNVNGDTTAAEIAAALKASKLVFLTDVAGVLDISEKMIQQLYPDEVLQLIASGVASEGMVPKLEACLRAVESVPLARIIDGRQPHALLAEAEGRGGGTTILPKRKTK